MSLSFKVGTFAKRTTTGIQAITGMGFQPKAIIFWTSGGTADGTIRTQATGDARMCVGFAAVAIAPETDPSQFSASTNADTAGGGGRRQEQSAIILADLAGATAAEAHALSMDTDGFTLDWSTNNGEAQRIHYLAFGGTDIRARVMAVNILTGANYVTVTGVGFQPTLVMLMGAHNAFGAGATGSGFFMGAAQSRTSRWAASFFSAQTTSAAARRWHRKDRCLQRAQGVPDFEMDLVSMDPDGATFDQRTHVAGGGVTCVMFLELPGEVVLGSFTKPIGSAPASMTVSGMAFKPKTVLLVSNQDTNRSNVDQLNGARLGISAFHQVDEVITESAASVFSIPHAPNPITFACYEKDSRAASKLNNATPAIDAEMTMQTLGNSGGFTMSWNPNDAVATEYLYIAFGDSPAPNEGHNIEIELDGPAQGWTNLAEDLLISPSVKIAYGLSGPGPLDLAPRTGTCGFSLDNSEFNSGGARGWYSPDSIHHRRGPLAPDLHISPLGFKRGAGVRYRYRVPGTLQVYTKFLGRLQSPEPESGIYRDRRTACEAVDWIDEASDFDLKLPLQINKRTDEILRSIVESIPTQPGPLEFDVADSTFPYALDNDKSAAALTEIQRLMQSEYGRFYLRGTLGQGGMVARFEKRTARLRPVPVASFIGTMRDLKPATDIRNLAKVSSHPKIVDAANTTVLYAKPATSTPFVPAGGTIQITGKYSSSADRANRVAGTDMQTPTATTDYLMNAAANGSGTNLTANFTVTAQYFANQVDYTITNGGGTDGYVTFLQARGRGIYDYTQVDAVRVDDTSRDKIGEKPITLDMPYQSDFLVADAVAQFMVTTWSTPGFASAVLRAIPRDTKEMAIAMGLEPGDPIAVAEEMTGINGIYFIQDVSIEALEENLAIFEWGLQRALIAEFSELDTGGFWELGTAGFSELGVTTVLAPL